MQSAKIYLLVPHYGETTTALNQHYDARRHHGPDLALRPGEEGVHVGAAPAVVVRLAHVVPVGEEPPRLLMAEIFLARRKYIYQENIFHPLKNIYYVENILN